MAKKIKNKKTMATNWFFPASEFSSVVTHIDSEELNEPTPLSELDQFETILDEEDANCKAYEADEEAAPVVLTMQGGYDVSAEFFGTAPKPPHK